VPKKRERATTAEILERADLAVYSHRVLVMLRPLDALDCDAVLRAALELNRASHFPASADELPHPPAKS
jgi:hypothetical protein